MCRDCAGVITCVCVCARAHGKSMPLLAGLCMRA